MGANPYTTHAVNLKVTGRAQTIYLHTKTVPMFKEDIVSVGQIDHKKGIPLTKGSVYMSGKSQITATANVIGI